MLTAIVETSLRHRGAVIAAACLLAAYGFASLTRTKLDVFPEFAPPIVEVHTEAPGLDPGEVEALVTGRVESSLGGAGDLAALRSQSIQGLSVVTAVFDEGTDVYLARQRVAERLAEVAGELPAGTGPPVLAPLTSSTSLVLSVGLTSAKLTPLELRTLADRVVRPRLLGVRGVANVVEFGGEVRQLQVRVGPGLLAAHGLTLKAVAEAARDASAVAGAGFVETRAQRLTVRAEGPPPTAEAIGEGIVASASGGIVRLKDVARVADGPAPRIGAAAINGTPGVLLLTWSQYGANTLEVTAAVESALEELKPAIEAEGAVLHPRLFRPATFIERSLRNVAESLCWGAALVTIVLVLFLFNWRTAFISLTAIPLSLLSAVLVLRAWGATLNTLTLGGLAIAIGEVVDDAIIDVENIHRRLQDNRLLASPRPALRVVLDASCEVRSSVVHATFVVALVFLPVLTMPGIGGKLYAPLGASYVLATLASLAVALTLTPALSLAFLSRSRAGAEPGHLRRLKAAHRRALLALAPARWWIGAGSALLCAGAAAGMSFIGRDLLPEFQEGHLIVQLSAIPGTSLEESLGMARAADLALLAIPGVRSAAVQAGRAELGEDTVGPEFSETVLALDPPRDEEESEATRTRIRAVLAGFPGFRAAVKPFLEERIEETISGARSEVAVRVYGEDLDAIDRVAEEAAALLGAIRGARDVRLERSVAPYLSVRLRPERLAAHGVRAADALEAVRAALTGLKVGELRSGVLTVDVVVTLDGDFRAEPDRIGRLLVDGQDGSRVPLGELADVHVGEGRHRILHSGARRYQQVGLNVEGRDLRTFSEEARLKLSSLALPHGVHQVALEGSADEESRATRDLLGRSALAGAGILVLLGLAFRRPRNLVLVLLNLPFAFVGGIAALLLSGGEMTLGSLIGFVTLFGITMRNTILLVSHYEHIVAVEGAAWSLETAARGASERLVPVLMTALVTGLGLLPIALGSGEAGREIEGPMAQVILGGLVTSTVLSLLVLPLFAVRMGKFEASPDGPRTSAPAHSSAG